MDIHDDCIDDAVHAAIKALKQSGKYFTTEEYCMLNDRITAFLQEDCGVNIVSGPRKPSNR
jgi:hypothetical protein